MILIDVTGGSKSQRVMTQKTVEFCIRELMPRIKNISVQVSLKKIDAAGYCTTGDEPREYLIEVDPSQSLKEFITTVCHEMVHVKQYVRNEMDPFGGRWKKRKVSDSVDYWDQPWEKEAFRLQDKLALAVWNSDIL